MIRIEDTPAEGDSTPNSSGYRETLATPPGRPRRKPRGISTASGQTGDRLTFLNPSQVAEMWGIAHDKVLQFIKTGELEAFNVASKKSSRPQFKIPLAALQRFQERRSGRDPARSVPRPSGRRSSRKSSASPTREYF